MLKVFWLPWRCRFWPVALNRHHRRPNTPRRRLIRLRSCRRHRTRLLFGSVGVGNGAVTGGFGTADVGRRAHIPVPSGSMAIGLGIIVIVYGLVPTGIDWLSEGKNKHPTAWAVGCFLVSACNVIWHQSC